MLANECCIYFVYFTLIIYLTGYFAVSLLAVCFVVTFNQDFRCT